ncbi:MAG: type II toxin-antitoxin system Phd/YefM family antitoxin [Flexilinea sp.]|nr:type II toxin-antitoxin system Phd/YefM family antitoxin [Flexilinea sp.]
MTEKIIDYVPVSKLGRGYAGRIIDQMKENDSVVYILRNNDPEAVMLSMADYRELLYKQNKLKSDNKLKAEHLAGIFQKYADVSKINGEKEYYSQILAEKYGK